MNLQTFLYHFFLSDAIESLWSNIPNMPHEISAFCRVVSFQQGKALSLTETALSIFDEGYYKKPSALKIRIDEIRQSDNYDTMKYRIPTLKNWDDPSFNPIYRAYETNYVRLIQKYGTVFNSSKHFLADKRFNIVHIEKENGKTLMKIIFVETTVDIQTFY